LNIELLSESALHKKLKPLGSLLCAYEARVRVRVGVRVGVRVRVRARFMQSDYIPVK